MIISPQAIVFALLRQSLACEGEAADATAGAAPGFVAGLTQINFRVPVSFFHGFSGLYLSVPGPFSNQSGVYFYLQ